MKPEYILPRWRHIGAIPTESILSLEDVPEGSIGFIYRVEFNNGMCYIGRKALYHNRTLPPLKGKKRKRKKVVESDWKKYIGSIKDETFKEGLKNGSIFPLYRTILQFCNTKWEMTYYETKYLFQTDALLEDSYYNSNILGKFYKPKKAET